MFVKSYGFCLLLKTKIGKNISKKLNGKCTQKLLNHAKQSAIDATTKVSSRRVIQKTANATGDWK